MKSKKHIFIFILIMCLGIGLFNIPKVNAITETINYTFDDDILFESSDIDFDNSFNLRNQTIYSQDYEATYSFTNEIDGTSSTAIDFVDVDTSNTDTSNTIIPILDGHRKVLDLFDFGGISKRCFISNNLESDITVGTIEFWLRTTDASKMSRFILQNQLSTTSIDFRIDTDNFLYNDGIDNDISGIIPMDNTWYHIKLVFDCSIDTYEIWINNTLFEASADFTNVADTLILVSILTDDVDTAYHSFYDGIGYSFGINFDNEFSFDISGETSDGLGITFDGTNYWISDFGNDIIAEYQINGVHTGTTYDISAETSISLDLTFNNGFFYILDDDPSWQVDIYTDLGVYVSSFSIISQVFAPRSITTDNNYLYVLSASGGSEGFYRYTLTGVYTGLYIDTSSEVNAEVGLSFANDSFFVMSTPDDTAFQYDLTGSYTGISFATTGANNPRCITFNGTHISTVNSAFQNVHAFRYNTYSENDNLIPTLESNNLLEIEAYEFAYIAQNTLTDIGSTFIRNWSIGETSAGGRVFYDYQNIYTDRTVELNSTSNNAITLYNGDYNINTDFVNVTVGFNISEHSLIDSGFFYIEILESTETSKYIDLFVHRTSGSLNLYYDNTNPYNILFSGMNESKYYELNIMLNFELNKSYILISENSIVVNYSRIPFENFIGFEGIGMIRFVVLSTNNNDMSYQIDYCGVFNNGISEVVYPDSYGYLLVPLNEQWIVTKHYLVRITAKGIIGLDIFSTTNINDPYKTGLNRSVISGFTKYESGVQEVRNAYEREQTTGFSTLVFFFSNVSLELTYIKIEGVKLIQGSNEYFLEYERFSQVDWDSSYFFVDDSNRLQYRLEMIGTSLEYIQATFNITNENTNGSAISYDSFKNDVGFSFFRVAFLATSTLYQIGSNFRSETIILPQDKIVDSFIIIVNDNDGVENEGFATGFITNIRLFFIRGIETTIISLSLIELMIPLIIIIIPTLVISERYGRNLIVPMFILMSLIVTATQIIPIWLFFIIGFSSSTFILLRKNEVNK